MATKLKDGLYQVKHGSICAGFIVLDGRVQMCAPVLRTKIEYWKTKAVLVTNFKRRRMR